MCKFRDLYAHEIDVRVQQAKDTGVGLLLYKDARCDMNILDETVGSANWQREHYECKGNLFCRVGIREYDQRSNGFDWVWKSDCGTESNTEAQKGEASDSFKRACFNWGIGRELYTSPFIWVNPDNCNIKERKDRNGNVSYSCYDNFIVKSITIENKQITALEIYNQTKKCVAYTFGKKAAPEVKPETPKADVITYEKALELIVPVGEGVVSTLKDIYKTNRPYINELAKSDSTPEHIKQAIAIINAEIRKANAK